MTIFAFHIKTSKENCLFWSLSLFIICTLYIYYFILIVYGVVFDLYYGFACGWLLCVVVVYYIALILKSKCWYAISTTCRTES